MPEPNENGEEVEPTNLNEESGQQPQGEGEPQLLEIGEEKIPLDQATELVTLGRTFKGLREKYKDVDFEGMAPTFTQQSQLLRDPEKLEKYLQEKFPDRYRQPAQPAQDGQANEAKAVAQFLRSLGFVSKDDFDGIYKERRQAEQYEDRVGQLAEELDGKDGRPKFDREQVEAFMVERNIFDPEAAYEKLHRDALNEWYAAKKLERKPKGTGTERGGAGPQLPPQGKIPKFGSPEMSKAIDQALEGTDETD